MVAGVSYEATCSNLRTGLQPLGEPRRPDLDALGETPGSRQPFERAPDMTRGNQRLHARNNIVRLHDTAYLDELP